MPLHFKGITKTGDRDACENLISAGNDYTNHSHTTNTNGQKAVDIRHRANVSQPTCLPTCTAQVEQ